MALSVFFPPPFAALFEGTCDHPPPSSSSTSRAPKRPTGFAAVFGALLSARILADGILLCSRWSCAAAFASPTWQVAPCVHTFPPRALSKTKHDDERILLWAKHMRLVVGCPKHMPAIVVVFVGFVVVLSI
jgi:hypothetical protein